MQIWDIDISFNFFSLERLIKKEKTFYSRNGNVITGCHFNQMAPIGDDPTQSKLQPWTRAIVDERHWKLKCGEEELVLSRATYASTKTWCELCKSAVSLFNGNTHERWEWRRNPSECECRITIVLFRFISLSLAHCAWSLSHSQS